MIDTTFWLSSGFWMGVFASLLVAFITWVSAEILEAIRHKAPLTGYWYSLVIENGAVVKSDWYHLYHNKRTGEIVGKMVRVYPNKQIGREWKVSGMFNLQMLILYSYSHSLNTSMASAVCRLVQDNYFEGSYLRYSEEKRKMDQIDILYRKITMKSFLFHRKEIEEKQEALVAAIANGSILETPFH